jgi:hypothetical protein
VLADSKLYQSAELWQLHMDAALSQAGSGEWVKSRAPVANWAVKLSSAPVKERIGCFVRHM